MAVVSRPPAATGHSHQQQQQQHRKARAAGRSSGVLYGSSGELGVDEAGTLHHKEWNARAHGSSGRSNYNMSSRSGRSGHGDGVTFHHGDVEFAAGGRFGSWCGGCMTRSGAMSPPPRGTTNSPGVRKLRSGEVKLSGDIGALVKNFSGSFERTTTPGSSPAFRPRLSPGKVSPLVEAVPPPAAAVEPAVQQGAAASIAVFSMGSFNNAGKISSSGNSTHGVSSSPPVEKIKASPTLFEMMSHEQELQGVKVVHTLSLSQQLTFQEKMKTILSGC